MMRTPRFLLPILAVSLALGMASAADQPSRVGKIDMERVFKEYKLYQQLTEQFNAYAQKLVSRLEQRSKRYSLLLDEEWNRLAELLDKGAAATPAERAALQELQKVNNDRDVELAKLEGLPEFTDAQKKRFQELAAKRTQARQGIEEMKLRVKQQIDERDAELTAQFNGKLQTAVEQVADQLKLEVVVQSQVVLFGGTDITDQVITALNAAVTDKPANGDKPANP